MEKINRHNYEAFFLDYLEGNLAAEQEEQLMAFLKIHPELRDELEEMMDVDLADLNLTAPDQSIEDKSELLKSSEELEERMIAAVECLLSDVEVKKLESEVASKNLNETYQYYQNTKLKADASIEFEDKSDLKRRESVIIPMFYKVASAAAVIVLLIGLYFMDWNSDSSTNNSVAEIINGIENSEVDPKSSITSIDNKTILENDQELDSPQQNTIHNLDETHINEVADNKQLGIEENDKKEDSLINVKDEVNPINNIVIEDDPIVEDLNLTKDERIQYPFEDQDNNADVVLADNGSNQKSDKNKNEQPYKLITDAAGNLFNREIYYKQEKQSNNEVVAHHFKLGNFEFQRKKH